MTKYLRMISHIKAFISSPKAHLYTWRERRLSTDIERWQSQDNLSPDWDERTALIATFIPAGSSVIEFGAAKLVLKKHLHESCTYQPSDLVKRSEETIILDLNGPLPNLPIQYDVAVFSGVLEYINDIEKVAAWLQTVARSVVFSYATIDYLSDPITRWQSGWVNNLSDKEVRALMLNAGWRIKKEKQWNPQTIYFCERDSNYINQRQIGA